MNFIHRVATYIVTIIINFVVITSESLMTTAAIPDPVIHITYVHRLVRFDGSTDEMQVVIYADGSLSMLYVDRPTASMVKTPSAKALARFNTAIAEQRSIRASSVVLPIRAREVIKTTA